MRWAPGGARARPRPNLAQPRVSWSANFFATYTTTGGNGAAMRIQPHVWAGQPLMAVVEDAVCTHGHMRAILGATLHATCLASVLRDGEIPRPDPALLDTDVLDLLGLDWIRAWEAQSGQPLDQALRTALAEGRDMLAQARSASDYVALATQLGALDPRTRGSGLSTAVLALALAWLYADDPVRGLIVGANLLESDTDTIASMAGALLGALHADAPPTSPADADLIAAEAERLWRISESEDVDDFPHPDPWTPPRSIVDTMRLVDGGPELAGLGAVEPLGPPHATADAAVLQWMRLRFGQDVLVKHRVPW